MATVTKTFTVNSSWTAPAGVKTVAAVVRPQVFPPSTGDFTQVIMNPINDGTLFLDAAGNSWGMGNNANGSLGNNNLVAVSSPVLAVGGFSFVALCGTANPTTFGLTASGQLYAWGLNSPQGYLGVGDIVNRSSPTPVVGGYTFYKASTVSGTAFGLTPSGQLYAWGDNSTGLIGNGTLTPTSSPTLVSGAQTWINMWAAVNSQCMFAQNSAGQLYAWGTGTAGQLGNGGVSEQNIPTAVLGGITNWVKISSWGNSILGLTATGQLYAWGSNSFGQLGLNDVVARSSPVLVLGGLTFSDAMMGNAFGVGLTTGKQIYTWGNNGGGNLGDGTTVAARSSPVLVAGTNTYSKVQAGDTVMGLGTDGNLYNWGSNGFGQGGVGDIVNRSSPTLVVGGFAPWSDVMVSSNNVGHTFGVTQTGQLYAWGLNSQGELGLGDVARRSSPTLVIGSHGVFSTPSPSKKVAVSVVPGTTYSVNMQQYYTTFGGVVLSTGPVSSVTLIYNQ
jgi:alpha-tubulin suppressor-like RCC1 family protein